MKHSFLFLSMALLVFYNCGKDKTTQPPAPQGSLLLNKLAVSMVPGGSESITICATDPDGSSSECTISNSNPEVASVSLSDSILQITGLTYGITNVTVTSGNELIRTVPVQVYNPFILDTGELLVTFVDSFTWICSWEGAGPAGGLGFHRAVAPDEFYSIGFFCTNRTDPNGNRAMMVVKAKAGSDALAEPVGYNRDMHQVGWIADPDGYFPRWLSIWSPIPPEGYVALGCVASLSTSGNEAPPPLDLVVCVREDLTIDGQVGEVLWGDPDPPFRIQYVDQPDAGPHEYCYLTTGAFVGWQHNSPPVNHSVLHVLNVELPMLAEAPYQSYVPGLTSFEEPPLVSQPTMAKVMLVPCTIVNDQQYSGNLRWRIANSPLYRLERQVFYKRLYHNHNTSSQPQTNSVTITSGVTTTEGARFWEETSIEVSVEAGLSIEAFSGKVSTTVSRKFGYETQTSVAELELTEVQTSINTAPATAAACWQKYNRYVLFRHNGVDCEPVYQWEFGIDSYVVDDYPDQ